MGANIDMDDLEDGFFKKTRWVLFDADDTLWPYHKYWKLAETNFINHMESLGFNRYDTSSRLDTVDRKNINIYGYTRDRYATSMMETYRFLANRRGANKKGHKYSEHEELNCGAHGYTMFERVMNPYPHVIEELKKIKDREIMTIMWTLGEEKTQKERLEKLSHTGILDLFDEIEITSSKSVESLFTLLNNKHRLLFSRGVVVGNSFDNDIYPAVANGINAIWLEHDGDEVWNFSREKYYNPGGLYSVVTASSFEGMADLVHKWTRNLMNPKVLGEI